MDHFRLLRQQTSIPIAMAELFNTQHEDDHAWGAARRRDGTVIRP